ncbi:hypothetical protein [Luteimonas sp. SDU101]|uniref:hypothetical protein n=1 Tax=unclassified Luteimonas TaxID=2629088 RepID=UPI003EB6E345
MDMIASGHETRRPRRRIIDAGVVPQGFVMDGGMAVLAGPGRDGMEQLEVLEKAVEL